MNFRFFKNFPCNLWSSDKKGSKHYSDQMELYLSFKTKKMTLDKGKVYENAKDIYSPK